MTEPLVVARDLHVTFRARSNGRSGRRAGSVEAVRGVDLELRAGQTLALVGESGSGKTTVGRAILGLTPARGSVRWQGTELLGLSGRRLREARRGMQLIFQDPYSSLDPRWTVERILLEALPDQSIGRHRREIGELLDSVGLPLSVIERLPSELSGGQRQRVAIARSLATNPQFVVCDEPTSALDVTVGATIIQLLRELQERTGVAYLFISHDLAAVRGFADTVAVMSQGAIVETGPVRDVFERPDDAYTKVLLGASSAYSLAGFLAEAGR